MLDFSEYRQSFFWSKVNKTETCWLWTAAVHKKTGYGIFNLAKPKVIAAHRYSYELENGKLPEGIEVDHKCHVELCVNPAHLRQATSKQNKENRRGATRQSKSGIRGVSLHKASGLWRACATHNGKHHNFGYFKNIDDADKAAQAGRDSLFTHHKPLEEFLAEKETSQ